MTTNTEQPSWRRTLAEALEKHETEEEAKALKARLETEIRLKEELITKLTEFGIVDIDGAPIHYSNRNPEPFISCIIDGTEFGLGHNWKLCVVARCATCNDSTLFYLAEEFNGKKRFLELAKLLRLIESPDFDCICATCHEERDSAKAQ